MQTCSGGSAAAKRNDCRRAALIGGDSALCLPLPTSTQRYRGCPWAQPALGIQFESRREIAGKMARDWFKLAARLTGASTQLLRLPAPHVNAQANPGKTWSFDDAPRSLDCAPHHMRWHAIKRAFIADYVRRRFD
jgi:hypothetical protein